MLARGTVVTASELFVCPFIQNEHCFTVQIVRRPVGSNITAVPPDRSALHTAHRLPDVLAVLNFLFSNQELSVRRNDSLRNRWGLTENFRADPTQYRKRNYDNRNQEYPKFFHFFVEI